MNQQSIAKLPQTVMSAHQGFGGGPLHEGSGLLVHGAAQEIIGGGVADIELNSRIQRCEFHKVRGAGGAVFFRRLLAESGLAQLIHRLAWLDAENIAIFGADSTALEDDFANLYLGGDAILVAREHEIFAVVQSARWITEVIS